MAAPLLAPLPRAVLAAAVIVAMAQEVDLRPLRLAWACGRDDFAAAPPREPPSPCCYTCPAPRAGFLLLRIDESLFFAIARRMAELVDRRATERGARDVVLMCSAVNEIDLSALEALEDLAQRLSAREVRLHLSEVKGPVEDRLRRTGFLDALSGRVFLFQDAAFRALGGAASVSGPGSGRTGRATAGGRTG
jgi:anti-anti-sigma factor